MRKRIEQALADEQELARRVSDLDTLFELAREGEPITSEIGREIQTLRECVERLETAMLLSGPNDSRSALVTIHPGAGGTESQDWAEMLLRMYLRWAEREDFNTAVTDRLDGDGAGIKSVTFEVNGANAYGLLQSEIGVHRLVRISPFDANARRHTSFASVFVYPQIDDEIKIDIRPEDLRVDTFRASGAGGQHVNKVSSAVHLRFDVVASSLPPFYKEELFAAPAYPLESIYDPTGAGDCFAGGFIGHIARTEDVSYENMKRAVIYGSTIASFSVPAKINVCS